jgi:hypothetical protein
MAAGLTVQNIGQYPANGSSVDSGLSFSSNVYTPGSTTYLAGYLDGESRARLFYTDGSAISLPQLAKITRNSIVDSAGTTKTGSYTVTLTWPAASAGSPDLSSIGSEIFLDFQGMLIIAGTAFG